MVPQLKQVFYKIKDCDVRESVQKLCWDKNNRERGYKRDF